MSYSTYHDYVDNGVEWVGKIPKHWDMVPLRAVLTFRNEKNDPVKTEEILSLSIAKGVTKYSDEGRGGNKRKDDITAYKIAHPNDIVMNSMNVIVGAVGMSKYYGAISPVYYALYKSDDNSFLDYYGYIFQNEAFQKELLRFGKGILIKISDTGKMNTIRMKVSQDDLKVMYFPKPSFEEQTQIANFLDRETAKIDTLIEKQQQLIKLLQEKRQAVISHAVTKGLNLNAKMKDSGVEWLGEVPEHWEVSNIRYLGQCQNGINIGGDMFGSGYPFVSYGDVYNNKQLPQSVAGLVQSTEKDREAYSIKYGDVLFTRTSETIDEIGFSSACLSTLDNAVFAGFLIRFRPEKYSGLNPLYSKYYFQNELLRAFFVREMNLVTRASLSQDLLKKMPVTLPPEEEQREIAEYLENKTKVFNKLIEKSNRAILLMKERRSALISSAVTGKIDVRNAA
ncbi:restriction endonuclease subunit S [Teredinibacter turnerae]|uniref:restriction endonuclease subunit S n=1 Tax=Teredinibacter turnerae TaxID=2426 RepID=UPI00035E7CE6|nr:restriction endonuclease subunit S [Teredinibacter turnerae]